ncbi:WecB/TagA/CpsF family glycosyltransferase [Melioribacter sp. Ez-97]|uniref:WecB/TagA/CpsF family glycosyltransferase n=1 Tax=Melioribacter sp. Ez-97 TaxID=3423434 RepID=UPI003ED8D23A
MKLIIRKESINLITQEELFLRTITYGNSTEKLITYINQNTVNLLHNDNEYLKSISREFLCVWDGTGLWLSALFKNIRCERILFTNALIKFLGILNEMKMKMYFVGGNYNVESLRKKISPIKLTGYTSGYCSKYDWSSKLEELNRADVVMIGMGQPRQEYTALELKKFIKNKIIVCCGAFMDYYTGTARRAPLIMQKYGLEWFYRIYENPGKYGKRYLVGIPKFLFRMKNLSYEK